MAAKKTRGKGQLGKGRFSEREVARQQKSYDRRLAKAAGFNPTGKMTDLDKVKPGWALEKGGESKYTRDPGDKAWRKEQKAKSGTTTRWSKSRISKENASRTAGETKGPRGMGKTKAQKAAATRALNIEESKRKGTYTGKASKLKQKVKVKSRAGGAAFNPKLLGSRYSPTDFTRGGRGPSGIPRKKL